MRKNYITYNKYKSKDVKIILLRTKCDVYTQFLFHGHEFILYLDKLNLYNIIIILFRQMLTCYFTVKSICIL